jgi:hypothetical protein
VPAEVSKRGVMIRNFEGALSSRRKRADIIIARPVEKSRKKNCGSKKKCRLFLLTAEKGENDVFHWVGVFSSRRKKM